ncbi:MAG TPA: DUF1206 domain-containing protein, partial [Chthoniobacterales bacterium]
MLPLVDANSQRWVVLAGRIGRGAQGFIYICVGLLSAAGGLQGGARASDSRRAISTISEQPFGQVVLAALIAGLLCYVVFRLLAALLDVEGKGSDAKGLLLRARSLGIAIIYSGIALAALRALLHSGARSGGGDQSARDWTARALTTPFGSWLVVLVGAAIVGGGLYQCYRAYRERFAEKLQLAELSHEMQRWLVRISAFGIGARGIVFAIAGAFLVQAGLQSNAGKARGLSGALN